MWPADIALFHTINATATTPSWVLVLANFASNVLPGLMLGALFLALVWGPSSRRRTVLQALLSVALAWCVVHLVRELLPFPRPAQLGMGMQWIEHGARPGFPSMHSATAFALAGTLVLRRTPTLAAAATLAAILIAWSRVCLGVHFPSDVLAGVLTGLIAAAGAHAFARHALLLSWQRRFSAYWSRRALPWARHR